MQWTIGHRTQPAAESQVRNFYEVFSVVTKSSDAPILVDVTIDKIPVRMEVDTGTSRSIMSESKFTSIYPPRKAPALRPVSTDLRTYTKEVVPVVGSAKVTVGYGNSTHVPTTTNSAWRRTNPLRPRLVTNK